MHRIVGIFCAGFILIWNQEIYAETLLDVYRLAEEKDLQFKGVQAAQRATLESRPEARALLLPSLGLSTNVARNFQDIAIQSRGGGTSVVTSVPPREIP